jgi:hypothetical protein
MMHESELLTKAEQTMIARALGTYGPSRENIDRIVKVIADLQALCRRVNKALRDDRECTGCTGLVEDYMVAHTVWVQATDEAGIERREGTHLCFICLEVALARRLVHDDFPDLQINRGIRAVFRLTERYGND